MPNSLEQFEAKYGKRGDGSLSYAGWDFRWEAWQAGAAAERERVNMPCTHENGYAKWDHWACRDCGAVKPDGVREGRPNNGWFPSMESFSAWKNGDRGIT
jgi:hypothetical protein